MPSSCVRISDIKYSFAVRYCLFFVEFFAAYMYSFDESMVVNNYLYSVGQGHYIDIARFTLKKKRVSGRTQYM